MRRLVHIGLSIRNNGNIITNVGVRTTVIDFFL